MPSPARGSPAIREVAATEPKDQQLMVALRIRPLKDAELEEGATTIAHKVGDQMMVLMDPGEDSEDPLRPHRSREKTFIFDMVFDQHASQEDVYRATTQHLVKGVVSGYNATVFAYGPSGAGKTYTMLGMDAEPGIYLQTLTDLFQALEETSDNMDYSVSMSYLEIYNEVIRDLLNPSLGFLDLREDSRGSIQIAGITEVSTSNAQEIMQLLTKGNRERTQEPTATNRTSSRSHAVLQVTVRQRSRDSELTEATHIGRLFMVDLAGSERASQTQNRGKRMKEGAHINRSLLALGNCINALSEKGEKGGRAQYVNFRDSKLTRLLKDALGGNSRTVMIAHISPASTHFEESRTTLLYAYRAKNIKTRVKRNLLSVSYHIAQYTDVISHLRGEIEHLKSKIERQEKEKRNEPDARDAQVMAPSHDAEEESRLQMNKIRAQLIGAFREQMEMRRSLVELENTNIELHIDTSRHLLTIADWEREKTHPREQQGSAGGEEPEADVEGEESEAVEPHEVALAREEINMLLAEQRRTAALKVGASAVTGCGPPVVPEPRNSGGRPCLAAFPSEGFCESAGLEQRLANAKKKASQMEQLLPRQVISEDQREVLRLLCRAHELEVENTALQAHSLYRKNLLCQKDFIIQRYHQHRLLCEQLIQGQRRLIHDGGLLVPDPLDKQYRLYSQELGEGTLNRLLLLHSLMTGALRDGSVLNISPPPEDSGRDQLDDRKDLPWGAQFELPPVLLETDSDGYSSSKVTPSKKPGKQDSLLPPSSVRILLTPPIHEKHSSMSVKDLVSKLCSPVGLDLGAPCVAEAGTPALSAQALREMASSTKSIALIAATRRSKVQDREASCSRSPRHLLEDGASDPCDQKPSVSPEPGPAGDRQQPHASPGRDQSVERRARKKRSPSLTWGLPPATEHLAESQPPPAALSQPSKSGKGFFPAVPVAAKIKPSLSLQADENTLQVPDVGVTFPSAMWQGSTGPGRAPLLPRDIRGSIDSGGRRHSPLPPSHPRKHLGGSAKRPRRPR
ncbi:PREDICTED: kinesin-like protein KIF19-like [Elephantulus edwardii]|uniref:kinesin-like protein KIF19-like n=1 Tax=Elephantulus edwardii TaxID=28737 RepID=UPI0003F0A816|nr:PREDICTED: kinesin-like protein KIF19-like [Elephantulus edwardii]